MAGLLEQVEELTLFLPEVLQPASTASKGARRYRSFRAISLYRLTCWAAPPYRDPHARRHRLCGNERRPLPVDAAVVQRLQERVAQVTRQGWAARTYAAGRRPRHL
ncbi:MAG: hypothetical protein R2867_17115 [Caldilineaceae bacterium]